MNRLPLPAIQVPPMSTSHTINNNSLNRFLNGKRLIIALSLTFLPAVILQTQFRFATKKDITVEFDERFAFRKQNEHSKQKSNQTQIQSIDAIQ